MEQHVILMDLGQALAVCRAPYQLLTLIMEYLEHSHIVLERNEAIVARMIKHSGCRAGKSHDIVVAKSGYIRNAAVDKRIRHVAYVFYRTRGKHYAEQAVVGVDHIRILAVIDRHTQRFVEDVYAFRHRFGHAF